MRNIARKSGIKAAQKPDLSYERLHQVLEYDPHNGMWRWKIKLNSRCVKNWYNGTLNTNGRYYIQIDRRKYLVSRLAFLYVKGSWPNDEVDHRNIKKTDNRFKNLRGATRVQNQSNRKPRNVIGIKGVFAIKNSKKYGARIRILNKEIYLGAYNTPEEAGYAYYYVAKALKGEFAYES